MSDQQSVASTSRPGSPIAPLPDATSGRPYRFAWDASGRKPGPASVSGTSEGRGDYFAYRPALGNFNLSSASLTLGAIPQEWSSSKLGFNAISNLVNSPQKRPAPPKAHAAVPPVIPVQLPRVRRKDFDAYLEAIGPEWEQFESNIQIGQEDSFASPSTSFPPGSPMSPRTPRPTPVPSMPALESIPSVFFHSGFDLSDARTFAAVTEQKDGSENDADPSALSHSLPLLERLSHYADTVEQHLVREISIRSSSFFAALTNLNELQTESSQCLERVRSLRDMLKEVDEKGAKKGLQLVNLEKKLKNLGEVQEAVKTIQDVGAMMGVARNLASGGELGAALGVVNDIQRQWDPAEAEASQKQKTSTPKSAPTNGSSSRTPPALAVVPESPLEEGQGLSSPGHRTSLPLSFLKSFSSLPEHLRTLTLEITSSLTSETIGVLRFDLVKDMDSPPAEDLSNTDTIANAHLGDELRNLELRNHLQPLLRSLRQTEGLRNSIVAWRDAVFVQIRSIVKQNLPNAEDLDEDNQSSDTKDALDRGVALRTRLRSMPHLDFLRLCRSMYSSLLSCIRRLQTQNVIFIDVLKTLDSSHPPLDIDSIQSDLLDILSSSVELAHSRVSKVMAIRAEQHASLDLQDFMGIFSGSWDFIIATETVCRRMIVGLRGVVLSQAKAFLQTMHQTRISLSSKVVEDELWSATDVSVEAQALVNVIIDSTIRDPPQLRVSDTLDSEHAKTNGTVPEGKAKQLSIEDIKYYAVPATLRMIELLIDYLKIIVNLPLLTTDSVGRVMEFLKGFNSRTCQVVLGAGAMRSAGLKNITAKNLALASQTLSIVIALIPYVRECFRRHLNPKQAVMLIEFDKLKRDYQEHQHELHAKLVAIMGDRLSAHCKSLQTVDWSARRDTVNDYMVVLVKETVTLHKVLTRYLQDSASEYVMSQVFASVNHRLSDEYGKINLPTQEAKDRLLRDAKYIHQNLSALKGVAAPTAMLETVVNDKRIPRPSQGETQAATISRPNTPTPTAQEVPSSPIPTSPPHLSAGSETAQRLKSIFRRSSMMQRSDSEKKDSSAVAPVTSPTLDKKEPLEISLPPPTPEKPVARFSSPPPPSSPNPPSSRRSSYLPDKELPKPLSDGETKVPSTAVGEDGVTSPQTVLPPSNERVDMEKSETSTNGVAIEDESEHMSSPDGAKEPTAL